jgi:hypothetical protein
VKAAQTAAVDASEQVLKFGPTRPAMVDEARFAHTGPLARGLAWPRS